MIERAHRFAFHWVYETTAIDEVGEAFTPCIVVASEVFGRHRQIGIEDGEELMLRVAEAEAHGVGLANACLLKGTTGDTI